MKGWLGLAGGMVVALGLVKGSGGWGPLPVGYGAIAAEGFAKRVSATGASGIDAQRLHRAPFNLLGRKVPLGQVEVGRPGVYGFDKQVTRSPAFSPAGIFFLGRRARSNDWVDGHAHGVAGVMVAAHKRAGGVAPGARLYAAASGFGPGEELNDQWRDCVASQTVATQQRNGVRAINFSFGRPLTRDRRIRNVLDGNALLTLCVDWSARVHDVLYTIAGNQGTGGISIPTDTFNGINIASTGRYRGQFAKLDFSNLGNVVRGVGDRRVGRESNTNGRGSVGLVAPGADVALLRPDGSVFYTSGTSFAAPRVAGVVGLLQEYGDGRNFAGDRQWSLDSQRHQVMKAVLLNSADKVKDPGDGRYLGMGKTIWMEKQRNWLESDALDNPREPLDAQLGTGQLNAFRALTQFQPGQWGPGTVPPIGWDFNRVGLGPLAIAPLANPPGETNGISGGGAVLGDQLKPPVHSSNPEDSSAVQDYEIGRSLQGGHYFSATLAWSRHVDLVDRNGNNQFDPGETFINRGLSDLDLYLMPLDDPSAPPHVCSSVSSVDSVEHIFCQVPATGRYKLRVALKNAAVGGGESYGLAWWSSAIAPE